jgi:hypothetical protein
METRMKKPFSRKIPEAVGGKKNVKIGGSDIKTHAPRVDGSESRRVTIGGSEIRHVTIGGSDIRRVGR